MSNKNNVFTSSGNVFADLGLANSEDSLIKARLARKISEIIAARRNSKFYILLKRVMGLEPTTFTLGK